MALTSYTLHGKPGTIVVGPNNGTHYHIPASGVVTVWDPRDVTELKLAGLTEERIDITGVAVEDEKPAAELGDVSDLLEKLRGNTATDAPAA